jgi:hypothetical protein
MNRGKKPKLCTLEDPNTHCAHYNNHLRRVQGYEDMKSICHYCVWQVRPSRVEASELDKTPF